MDALAEELSRATCRCTPRERTCSGEPGHEDESAAAYRRALELARNEVEREFIERRLSELAG